MWTYRANCICLIKYCLSWNESRVHVSFFVHKIKYFINFLAVTTNGCLDKCHLVMFLSRFYSIADDSDSDSESSSEEEVTQNGSSSGGRRTNAGTGSAGGQKRHRKKRGVAIPVATPKVPTLPPTTVAPRPHPQTTPDAEKGKMSWNRSFKIVFNIEKKLQCRCFECHRL